MDGKRNRKEDKTLIDMVSLVTMVLATFITFGLYSILTGVDNPFYAFAEYSFIGAAIGLLTIMALTYLQQKVFSPIMSNPGGSLGLIIALLLGIMVLTRVSPEYSYIARIPITIGIAIGVGISTRTLIFTNVLAQIKATILPLWGIPPFQAVTNLLILVFMISTLFFFLYTIKVSETMGPVSNLGKYVLYAGFGALYAQTFMGRIGLFLGRMETMLFPETQFYITIIVIVIILASIYYLNRRPELLKKLIPS